MPDNEFTNDFGESTSAVYRSGSDGYDTPTSVHESLDWTSGLDSLKSSVNSLIGVNSG